MKKIHHFAYLRGSFEDNPRLHELRDGEAFAEIQGALHELGFTYGGLLLNYPLQPQLDVLPTYDPADVIVLTTRPPLDDELGWDRKKIERSYTKLEHEILAHVRPLFRTCRRTVIQLARPLADELGTFMDRASITFGVYGAPKKDTPAAVSVAVYKATGNPYTRGPKSAPATQPCTSAFLVVRRLEPNGPTLIVAFGMDGIMTLVWCYLLRTRFPHLLRSPRFVMAEIWPRAIPANAQSLAFADDWRVDFPLDVSAKRLEELRLTSETPRS